MQQVKPAERLEQWLNGEKLPERAKACIENFVCSCEKAEVEDIMNFLYVDTVNFCMYVRNRLIEGFCFAYFGMIAPSYQMGNMAEYFEAILN